MERPALKRLLADTETGEVDAVVVYKVDRLTRALSDFAKLVEVFDRRGVSFVSITQQFNTTTSMGRLTLNVLLSFAQFEREVIGERVRDKIAASKKKGMWMGGMPPLGYGVKDRKLIVNGDEARSQTDHRQGVAYRAAAEITTAPGPVRPSKRAERCHPALLMPRPSKSHLFDQSSDPLIISRIFSAVFVPQTSLWQIRIRPNFAESFSARDFR